LSCLTGPSISSLADEDPDVEDPDEENEDVEDLDSTSSESLFLFNSVGMNAMIYTRAS